MLKWFLGLITLANIQVFAVSLLIFVAICNWLSWAYFASKMAKDRNRSKKIWFIAGGIFGVFAIIAVILLDEDKKDEQ